MFQGSKCDIFQVNPKKPYITSIFGNLIIIAKKLLTAGAWNMSNLIPQLSFHEKWIFPTFKRDGKARKFEIIRWMLRAFEIAATQVTSIDSYSEVFPIQIMLNFVKNELSPSKLYQKNLQLRDNGIQ